MRSLGLLFVLTLAWNACANSSQSVKTPTLIATLAACPSSSDNDATGFYTDECIRSLFGQTVRLPSTEGQIVVYTISTPGRPVQLTAKIASSDDDDAVLFYANTLGVGQVLPIASVESIDGVRVEISNYDAYITSYWHEGEFSYSIFVPRSYGEAYLLKVTRDLIVE